MNKQEIFDFLNNKKVYVNGKSAEIQEKLFEFGFCRYLFHDTIVSNLSSPFIEIKDGLIFYSSGMLAFNSNPLKEITAERILQLNIAISFTPGDIIYNDWEDTLGIFTHNIGDIVYSSISYYPCEESFKCNGCDYFGSSVSIVLADAEQKAYFIEQLTIFKENFSKINLL